MVTAKAKDILRYREQGLGYKRIAALTGYSINTVKSVCRRNPDGAERFCPQCGAMLTHTPHHREKKFCSDKCRMAWWNSHPEAVNRKAVYHFTCAQCGQPFDSYGNDHRKYCSRACYAEARRKGV
ncbi:RNA polymerase subunit sigma-70 [Acutalibacter intestini]|jgi:endogenous inhibitor of DNA gyrase (YacG/DUF329 family)|uniref:RNA polymerase subunit sigma-70 n=1 Tax=Acutalibacter intestini TaxID=3093659 RepID=UPI002AC94BFC|nr:RNA polymerase subunit sigma-70 [Acutalibacter sp. M00204]